MKNEKISRVFYRLIIIAASAALSACSPKQGNDPLNEVADAGAVFVVENDNKTDDYLVKDILYINGSEFLDLIKINGVIKPGLIDKEMAKRFPLRLVIVKKDANREGNYAFVPRNEHGISNGVILAYKLRIEEYRDLILGSIRRKGQAGFDPAR